MNERLTLDEFDQQTTADWRAAAEESLKGAPFEKKLVARTPEGIAIQPIYDRCTGRQSLPGFPDFRRGTDAVPRACLIAQDIPYGGPKFFNDALRTDIERGQTAINLSLDAATRRGIDPDGAAPGDVALCGLSIATEQDLDRALDGIDLENIPLFIQAGSSGVPLLALLAALFRTRRIAIDKIAGAVEMDPLSELATDGALPASLETLYDQMAIATRWCASHAPKLRTIGIETHAYHDAGAHAVQELAFAIATAVEALRQMEKREIAVETAANAMRYSLSVGADFFMAIAKFRALRVLHDRVIAACGGSAEARKARIHARTSLWNRSKLDPYVNILRSTTEAFSAVAGGCDSLHVGAFDEVIRPPDEFSRRIARNTQIILRDECNFDRVIDPAGGSGFVESLTDDLARKAWELFQAIEAKGGMAAALLAGYPQELAGAAHAERAKAVALRRQSLVGVNQYANPDEQPLDSGVWDLVDLQRKRAATIGSYRTSPGHASQTNVLDQLSKMVDAQPSEVMPIAIEAVLGGATLGEVSRTLNAKSGPFPAAEPLPVRRLAEPFETLRAATRANPPKAFLANMGGLSQHRARADFSTAFLRAGGFSIVDPRGFDDVPAAIAAAAASGAPVVVICSTDATYPEIVPGLAAGIKSANPAAVVALAGYPEEQIETFKAAGVDCFIHLRADCEATLRALLEKIGYLS